MKTRHTRLGRHFISRILGCALAVALASMAVSACSRAHESDAEEVAINEDDLLPHDTVPQAPEPPKRLTFDGTEDLLAYMDASPDSARYRRGIMRRMAETAPEYVDSLLNSHCRRFLVCDKGEMRVFVFDSCGLELASYRMAAGKGLGNKHKKGDGRTPEGFFRVEGVYNSTEWLFTDDDGVTSQVKGQYGPRFIRVRTQPRRWPIGIHGTCAPWSIGGRRSHGCMRLKNEDILALVEYVDKDMPVIISPGTRDQRVNLEEGTPTRRIWTGGAPVADTKPSAPAADTTSAPASQHVDTVSSTTPEASEPEATPVAEPDTVAAE